MESQEGTIVDVQPTTSVYQSTIRLIEGIDNWLCRVYAGIGRVFIWTAAAPINVIAWTIEQIKSRRYDPTRDICPACGYDHCNVKFIRTAGPEKGAVQHYCLRCGCEDWFTPLFREAKGWLADPPLQTREDRIRDIAKRGVI